VAEEEKEAPRGACVWGRCGSGGVWPWVARGANAEAGRRGDGAPDGVPGLNVLLVHSLKLNTPKICIKVQKTLNTKVVDLNAPNNFHKGHMSFSQ
jgi:hypothetical protein